MTFKFQACILCIHGDFYLKYEMPITRPEDIPLIEMGRQSFADSLARDRMFWALARRLCHPQHT
jgi:hypothetical protein